MRKVTVHIAGMSCGHCLNAVNKALSSMPGIQVESVQMGCAVVSYDERTVHSSAIESAIGEAGYSVERTA